MPEELRREGGRRLKTKRVRTIFTPEQLERMEEEFHRCGRLVTARLTVLCRTQYMVGPDRVYLASRLNLTEAQVRAGGARCAAVPNLPQPQPGG